MRYFYPATPSIRSVLLGLTGFAAMAMPVSGALAGPSDPTSANLISNALPGETTSTSCNSNGFIVVTFNSPSGGSSSQESSTTCTPGGGGGSTPPPAPGGGGSTPAPDVQSEIEQDLLDQRINGLASALSDQLGEISQEEFDQGLDDANEAALEENPEFTDEEKAALLSSYRRQLAKARTDLNGYRGQISDLRSQWSAAESAAAQNRPQLEADLRAAEAAHARVASDVENLPTVGGVRAAQAEYDEAIRIENEYRAALNDPNHHRPKAYLQNKLNASEARRQQAYNNLQEAKAAHATASSQLEIDRRLAVANAKTALINNDAQVDDIERDLEGLQDLAGDAQSNISRLQGLISALESQNQLAGPSGDAFETLRANGIEFWSRGSWLTADDTQSGRRQEIEQKNITVGVHGRFSERLLLGLAVSYIDGENADQTGAGISTDTETFLFAPYLAYQLNEDLALDAGAVYGMTDVDVTRAVINRGSYDARTVGGQVGLSIRHRFSEVISVTGRVGQSYTRTKSDGYTDTGGASSNGSTSEQAQASLTGRLNVTTDPDWRWYASTSVQYDVLNPGNGQDRLYGQLSTGLEYNPGDYAVSVQANRSVFRSNYQATGLGIQVRVPF